MAKKKKHPGGRPTKFTKENIDKIISYIENGNSYTDSCYLSGISQAIFYNWKKKGEEAIENKIENEFSEFLEKIEQAKRKYKAWLIQNMNTQAEIDGKLSLEILSRKYPEFRKKELLRIKGDIDIQKFDIPLTPAQRKQFDKRMESFFKTKFAKKEKFDNE